jgi:hypothetical protein
MNSKSAIYITIKTAAQALSYNDFLKADGLINGTDYTFTFYKNNSDWNNAAKNFVKFDFSNEEDALYYRLKWSDPNISSDNPIEKLARDIGDLL